MSVLRLLPSQNPWMGSWTTLQMKCQSANIVSAVQSKNVGYTPQKDTG